MAGEGIPGRGKTFLTETRLKETEAAVDHGSFDNIVAGIDAEAQSTLLLKKEQDMRIVDDALEYMKQEYRARMEEVHKEEEQLAADKAEMEAMVERFKDFIQDNDTKRSRAHLKQVAEEEACSKLKVEAGALTSQLEEAQGTRESLEAELARLERYAAYMDSVVAFRHEEYAETTSIRTRWETLQDFHEKNSGVIAGTSRTADEVRASVLALRQRTEDRVLTLSSGVQECTEQLAAVQSKVSELAEAAEGERVDRGSKAKDSRMVATSIRNMYNRCKATAPTTFPLAPTLSEAGSPEAHLAGCLVSIAKRLRELHRLSDGFKDWQRAQEREAEAKAALRQEAAEAAAEYSALASGSGKGSAREGVTHGRRGMRQRSTASLGTTSSTTLRDVTTSTLGRPRVAVASASTLAPAGTAVPTSQPGVYSVHIAAAGSGGLSPGSGSGALGTTLSATQLPSMTTL